MRMPRTTFERIVRRIHREIMESLDTELRVRAEEVTIVIADRPPRGDEDLLGLYEGVSLRDRHIDYMEAVADRITLFRLPLLDECKNEKELREEIRLTIIHELGHYFGFEEDELLNRGL